MPLITILVPCKNGEKFLHQMLASVLSQTFRDYEVIIVDDGSTDRSREIVFKYSELYEKIRLEESPGRGIVSAMNYGIEVSDSKFIARIDADDEMYPNRLESQVREFDVDSRLGVCGSSIAVCETHGDPVGTVHFPEKNNAIVAGLREGRWVIAHPAVMYQRTAIQRLAAYSEEARHAEDLDLWLRAAQAELRFKNLPQILTKFRVHGENDTIRKKELHCERRIYALWRDYSVRGGLSLEQESTRLIQTFSILTTVASKVNNADLHRLLMDLRDSRINKLLNTGFILQRFIFALLKHSINNNNWSALLKISALLMLCKANIFPYLKYYIWSIFPIYLKNKKSIKEFRRRKLTN